MKFIFIAGASASGKTTLAEKLQHRLSILGFDTQQITLDDYSVEAPDDVEDMQTYRRTTNFDRVEMYDFELLQTHIMQLHQGRAIEKPIFEFASNKRIDTQIIRPSDIIIIEGLFALHFAKMIKDYPIDKLTVFVGKSSYRSIIDCRLQRDVETRNFFATDVIQKERRNVGPAYFQIIAKSKSGVDFDITNDEQEDTVHPLDLAVDDICQSLIVHKAPSLSSTIP